MAGTPLTDAINALTTYSNTVTGASDTTLSEAVATLASGYGGGGTTQTLNNIFGNSMALVTGYLNSSGGIASQSSTSKEITTDYIDIEAYRGTPFWIACETPFASGWIAYMLYDSSKTAVGSRVTADMANTNQIGGCQCANGVKTIVGSKNITPGNTVKYIRFSCRTYGNAKIFGALSSETAQADYFTQNVNGFDVTNPIVSDGTARS